MVVGEMVQDVQLVVLGAGPGGYTAALRAAELGLKATIVDARPKPGGVCLHVGCIPSKALLHAAELANEARSAAAFGLHFAAPDIKVDELRNWKLSVTDKLAQGIVAKCKSAGVEIIHGNARFEDSKSLRVESDGESAVRIKFKYAIIASGSRPIIPAIFDISSDRVMDSSTALDVKDIPKKLLVVGGGYIGLEMATVYASLGSEVSIVEMTDGLLPGVDRDLVRPLQTHLQSLCKNIWLKTKVTKLEDTGKAIKAYFDSQDIPKDSLMESSTEPVATFDRALIAIGRRPNTDNIGLEKTQVKLDERGMFVQIDEQCRTSEKRIFCIGDASGQPMLAHRAMRQGIVAAEAIAGKDSVFDNRAIPAIVFTQPEVAWTGLTETEAKTLGREVAVSKYPWSANGRAHTLNDPNGSTKIIYDPETLQVLGIGMVGTRCGELITEAVVAIEMGAVLEDLAVANHPHPTLSETVNEAALTALARIERRTREAEKQKAQV